DGVEAAADAVDGELGGVDGGEDPDVEAAGVVVLQVPLDLGDDLRVVRALVVEPEHGRRSGGAGPVDGQLHPVADGCVLDGGAAVDVARRDGAFEERVAVGRHHAHGAWRVDLERLVVRAVLFSLLRHEANVGDGAHGARVEGAVGFAVV